MKNMNFNFKLLFLFAILFSLNLFSNLYADTVVVFISGDWDYLGAPGIDQREIKLEDQALSTYVAWTKKAKSDPNRDYVIFFDPKGRGRLFNNKWIRFKIYKHGKRVYSEEWKSEISSGIEAFNLVSDVSKSKLGDSFANDNSKTFFYYGEHFPARHNARIDLNGSENFGGDEILKGVAKLGKFKRGIFQTCYINNLRFLAPLSGIVSEIIVPKRVVLNHRIDPEIIVTAIEKQVLLDSLSTKKYPWIAYGGEVAILDRKIRELERYSSSWRMAGIRTILTQDKFEVMLQESYPNAIFVDAFDIILPIWDVVSIYDQYLLSNENLLDDVEKILDDFPSLNEIYDEI